jgi:hypothetical protein
MSPELDKILCEKYPKIFVDRNAGPMESLMGFGFETHDGWFDLLDVLCYNIQNHIDWCNSGHLLNPEAYDAIPQVIATQVKEKYGTLRFYTSGGDSMTNGMIQMAEAMSARICEKCGKPGHLRGEMWVYTACDEHAEVLK